MSTADEQIEQTLFIAREANVYRIPPRPGAGGHRSGEWKVADKLFTGRLRVISKGELCEVRLEDVNSGELFGVCPIKPGQRAVAVESVADSSRCFVLRLEDAASARHAFVGLGFAERGDAFDFNVALSDHEKQKKRAEDLQAARVSADHGEATMGGDAALLYQKKDLSLKEGETIRIAVKKNLSGGGFLSQLGSGTSGSTGVLPPPTISPVVPPPAQGFVPAPQGSPAQSTQPTATGYDLLGLGSSPASEFPSTSLKSNMTDNWATFD